MHDVSMQVVCTRTAFDNMCHENAQGYERMYEYVLLAFGWPVTSLVTHTYNMYSTWHQVYTMTRQHQPHDDCMYQVCYIYNIYFVTNTNSKFQYYIIYLVCVYISKYHLEAEGGNEMALAHRARTFFEHDDRVLARILPYRPVYTQTSGTYTCIRSGIESKRHINHRVGDATSKCFARLHFFHACSSTGGRSSAPSGPRPASNGRDQGRTPSQSPEWQKSSCCFLCRRPDNPRPLGAGSDLLGILVTPTAVAQED